ncbi:hypothetical protein JZ751_001139 [Albula glossodonta]|uniref:Sodium/calcium exchanger membrane region domain-containing protein n=1 Tax=Albula glossodonta TaxID=121402 RepID=A0A8T2PSV4_9TELE|nr:hypothetical protein JZ751_001139 [Albula glossodonta]
MVGVYAFKKVVLNSSSLSASGTMTFQAATSINDSGFRNGMRFYEAKRFGMLMKGTGDECHMVMKVSADQRCSFVQSTPDCAQEDGFIDYLDIAFCFFPSHLFPFAMFLFIVWLLFLFMALGLTASKFTHGFPTPSAAPQNVKCKGVTFLALGNGAPDVFSAMVAFSRPHTAGAGIFVTTVVAGCVALVKPFTVASRPFLRDVIFYMAAVFWTFVILYKGHISLAETLVEDPRIHSPG